MKTTISGILLQLACDNARQAISAHKDTRPGLESRHGLATHLFLAVAIEGFANEIGQAAFDAWTWNRIEKCDTPLKWKLISNVGNGPAFDQGEEPLSTIVALQKIRNAIAHPKVEDLGDELIVRSAAGELARKVSPDTPMAEGDTLFLGFGELLDKFNAKKTCQVLVNAISAVVMIKGYIEVEGLDWIDKTLSDAKDIQSSHP